ncbi:MAG: DNA-directed polymerase subunit delta [Firmicutes bacterium]|nr:DNA-directed polymerase subunit delta [Bacillota bacterium]
MGKKLRTLGLVFLMLMIVSMGVLAEAKSNNALVIQTDFGVKDGAVSAMKGVAFGVDSDIRVFDLTQEIPAYNIWEASYRLMQTAPYWPKGTVFVSVVDPGVGTERKSIVVKTKTGQFFVTPDNGTLTLISEIMGIAEVREIDENVNRLPGSKDSYTFFGRDVYAYTGARLASGKISYEQVGPVLKQDLVKIPYQKASVNGNVAVGTIPILDIQYGNVWTNIGTDVVAKLGIKVNDILKVQVFQAGKLVYEGQMPFANTFGDVPEGKPLAYYNSLMELSFALNMDSFSTVNKVFSGPEWSVKVEKVN